MKSSLVTLFYVEYPMDNFALTIEKHVNQQGNTDCIFNVSVSVWFTYYPSTVHSQSVDEYVVNDIYCVKCNICTTIFYRSCFVSWVLP